MFKIKQLNLKFIFFASKQIIILFILKIFFNIKCVKGHYSQFEEYAQNQISSEHFVNNANDKLFFLKNIKQSKLNFYNNNFIQNKAINQNKTLRVYVNDLCQLIEQINEEDIYNNKILQAKIGKHLFTVPLIQSIFNNHRKKFMKSNYKSINLNSDEILWQTYFLCSIVVQPVQSKITLVFIY